MAQIDHDHAPGEHAHGSPHADHGHGAAKAAPCCGGQRHEADKSKAAAAIDPVCGMRVDPATARHRTIYKAKDYFFCSGRCRERFEAVPEKFLQPKQPEPAASASAI